MMKILSAAQIREIEERADKGGISYLRLMENAGSACASVIRKRFDETDLRRVTVVCGKGKNGGDGFVIARKLNENGYSVNVILAMGAPAADTAIEMFSRLKHTGVNIETYDEKNENQKKRIRSCDLLVDCIFGTGFKGVPDEKISGIINEMSESFAYKVSIDLPSGMYADSSKLGGAVVRADLTIAAIALKYSLVYYPSAEYAGELKTVLIGIPEEILCEYDGGYTLSKQDISGIIPKRREDSHKGDYGKALVIAGSYEMPGAALMASSAAVECGSGIVKTAFPDKAYPVMMSNCHEKVLVPLESNRYGRISALSVHRIKTELQSCDAVLIGCGLGQDNDTFNIVKFVLENAEVPIILDADGINLMSDSIDIIKNAKAPVIVTPHPGEAARVLKKTVCEIQENRLAAARELHELTGATVVLKGSRTAVTADGRRFYMNTTGNCGMATGGSGDVLSGMILSLVGQGISPEYASIAAVYIHGMAGDTVVQKYSKAGVTPTKIINELAKIFAQFGN